MWDDLGRLGGASGVHHGLDDLLIRRVFESVFGGEESLAADEFVAALAALEAVLEGGGVPLGGADLALVDGVLKGLVDNVGEEGVVSVAARVVLRQDWRRAFGSLPIWPQLAEVLLQLVGRGGVDLEHWETALRLLAECGPVVVVGEKDARRIIANLERFTECDPHALESALRALYVVAADVSVAKRFAEADLARVLAEVSAVHARRVEVQHACVDVLVRLASPKVLQCVPHL